MKKALILLLLFGNLCQPAYGFGLNNIYSLFSSAKESISSYSSSLLEKGFSTLNSHATQLVETVKEHKEIILGFASLSTISLGSAYIFRKFSENKEFEKRNKQDLQKEQEEHCSELIKITKQDMLDQIEQEELCSELNEITRQDMLDQIEQEESCSKLIKIPKPDMLNQIEQEKHCCELIEIPKPDMLNQIKQKKQKNDNKAIWPNEEEKSLLQQRIKEDKDKERKEQELIQQMIHDVDSTTKNTVEKISFLNSKIEKTLKDIPKEFEALNDKCKMLWLEFLSLKEELNNCLVILYEKYKSSTSSQLRARYDKKIIIIENYFNQVKYKISSLSKQLEMLYNKKENAEIIKEQDINKNSQKPTDNSIGSKILKISDMCALLNTEPKKQSLSEFEEEAQDLQNTQPEQASLTIDNNLNKSIIISSSASKQENIHLNDINEDELNNTNEDEQENLFDSFCDLNDDDSSFNDLLNSKSIIKYLLGEYHKDNDNHLPQAFADQNIQDYQSLIKPGAELVCAILNRGDDFQFDTTPFNLESEDHSHRNDYLIDIVKICWFMYSLAVNKEEAHKEGAFIIHDDGKIFEFLLNYVKKVDSSWNQSQVKYTYNPYGCCRASTHINESQKNGYKHYGIDIRFSNTKLSYYPCGRNQNKLVYRSAILPAGQTHILFGKVDKERTFIKLENDGLYVYDGWDQHAKGAALSIGRKIPGGDYIFGSDDDPNFRKERVPKEWVEKVHKANLAIKALSDITNEYNKDSSNENLQELYKELKKKYPFDYKHRIGNEVILDRSDLECTKFYQENISEEVKTTVNDYIQLKILGTKFTSEESLNEKQKIKSTIEELIQKYSCKDEISNECSNITFFIKQKVPQLIQEFTNDPPVNANC